MDRDAFLEALFLLDPEVLAAGLPAELQAAADADPELAAEVAALRNMDAALPAMGRMELDEGFFMRQKNRVLAEVRERRSVEAAQVAWAAPRGSLVALFGVVGVYAALGLEGGALGSAGLPMGSAGGADPMNAFLVVYTCLLGVALYVFHMDSREVAPQRATATAGAGA